jgi:carboxyl-terminal processing protease
MSNFCLRLSCALLVSCSLVFAQDDPSPAGMSELAADYLDHALDLMRKNAFHRTEIDWTSVRSGAFLHARGAQTTSDTYPGIFFALTQLREHHSFLRIPDNLSEEEKRKIFVARRDIQGSWLRGIKLPPPSPFRARTQPEGHLLQSGGRTFAWIYIAACGANHSKWEDNLSDFRNYATKLHTIAASLENSHPSGWIVDLRGNGGGNMWPMLAGIGFVLGEGVAGSFVSSDGHVQATWSYQRGTAFVGSKNMNDFNLDPPLTLPYLPTVAVLIDSGTSSSGEAIAVSFEGRTRTRFFGTHSFGLSSSNSMYRLSDGASLFLNSSVDADRTNRRYNDGIEPDVAFPEPSSEPNEAADVALQAALTWLTTVQ